jgi:hypothetical protein
MFGSTQNSVLLVIITWFLSLFIPTDNYYIFIRFFDLNTNRNNILADFPLSLDGYMKTAEHFQFRQMLILLWLLIFQLGCRGILVTVAMGMA